MGFFNQPKPRRFHHSYQYIDERKERLRHLRSKDGSPSVDRESIHQAFSSRKHSRRRSSWQSIGLIVFLLLFLILLFGSLA